MKQQSRTTFLAWLLFAMIPSSSGAGDTYGGPAAAERLAAALRQTPASNKALEELLAETRRLMQADPSLVALIVALLSDPEVSPAMNFALLETLLTVDDAAVLSSILRIAREDVDRATGDPANGIEARRRVTLVLQRLLDHPQLPEMRGNPDLLPVLEWGSSNGFEVVGSEPVHIKLILSAPVDEGARSRLLTNILLAPRSLASVDCRLPFEVLTAEDRLRLHLALEEWSGELSSYPQQAVLALVFLGDRPAIDLLRAWSDSDRVSDQRLRESFGGLVALGKARTDPEAALGYIRTRDIPGGSLTNCALRSAVDLGVARDELRAALFERERLVMEFIGRRGIRRYDMARRVYLWPIKEAAIEQGIMSRDDWPDVVPPILDGLTP